MLSSAALKIHGIFTDLAWLYNDNNDDDSNDDDDDDDDDENEDDKDEDR